MEFNAAAFLKALLETSWQGSIVILLVLLIRPLLGVRVPARWRYLLWTLVLLRLLVPAVLMPRTPACWQNFAVVDRPLEQARLAFTPGEEDIGTQEKVRSQGPPSGDSASDAAAAFNLPAPHRPWWRLAAAVWVCGAALTGLWILAGSAHLHRRLRRDSTEIEGAVQLLWARCCANLGLRHPPRLVATDCVESPALMGLLRPVLLVPKRDLHSFSLEDWEHVFLHELAHYRRRDHWTQILQLFALCLHWFNPLVWLGFRCLRADRELAADEWALLHLAGRRPDAYGYTLLKVLTAQVRRPAPACMVGIMEDGAQLKQRLRHIVAFGPRRLAGSITGIAILLVLAAVVLGRQLVQPDLTIYAGLPPLDILVTAARNGDQPVVEKMLADGVDVNGIAGVKGERTALTAAITTNQLEMERLLVTKGADINFKPEKGEPPIVVAWKRGWAESADFLLSKGASYEPEMRAAAKGDAPAIEKVIVTGTADFEKLKTLCEIAAANGHAGIFATLYDAIRALPGHTDWESGNGLASNAIARGHRAVVEEMIKRGERLNKVEVMRLAPVAGQAPGMREWLESKGFHVPDYTDGERLIEATERENLPEMRRLLAAGTDVNYRGESKWTPLTKAATWGCPRAVKLLLEHHADPNLRKVSGNPGYTAIELAKTPEIAGMLAAAGAKVQPEEIEYPVGTGAFEMTRWFLDHGVDPKSMKDGGTSLLLETPKSEILRLLVEHGASIRSASKAELASLISTAWTPEAIELLIAAGADVNGRDKQGFTPLIQVLLRGSQAPAKLLAVLLKHGADPNSYTPENRTALMFARDAATIDALVAAGADLYAISDQGHYVALPVFEDANKARAEALAKYGVRDDEFMRTYCAAGGKIGRLSFAAGKGDLEQMRALLAAGADVDEHSEQGFTPLHFAVRCGQIAAARLLLDHGANVNRFDSYGLTAANCARIYSTLPIAGMSERDSAAAREGVATLFQKRKFDPNFRNEAGETAVMRAAASRSFSMEAVLYTGADINLQRTDGMTPLMLAVTSPPPKDGSTASATVKEPGRGLIKYSYQAYIVKLLRDRGADLSLRNKAGQTALDLARETGSEEILALLKGAKQ